MKRTLFAAACFLLALSPYARAAKTVRFKARYSGFSYQVEKKGSFLVYKEESLSRQIPIKPCNREIVENFLDTFQRRKKAAVSVPAKLAGPATITFKDAAGTKRVNPMSKFGRWLRDVPMETMELKVLSEARCKEKS